MKKLVLMAVAATFLLSFTAMAVMAQEKAKAEKAKTTQELKAKERGPAPVLFENDKVRVVDARTKPGERNPMQERSDRVIYHFNAGKTRVHYPDGKKKKGNSKRVVLSSASEIQLRLRTLGRPKITIWSLI